MNILEIVIDRFDDFIENIDYKNLPDRDSEEYRLLMLKTADEKMFSEGRYSEITEWILELFDRDDVKAALRDVAQINALTDRQRTKLRFDLDLRDVCYPLFHAQLIDWSAWPWNMKKSESSMDNRELYNMLTECKYPNLCAAICYDFSQIVWNDERYSSVARNDISQDYFYDVKSVWEKSGTKTDEDIKLQKERVSTFADTLWSTENHMLIGQQLGFDHIAQEVYDAMDSFIDDTYVSRQVDFAREMSAWINENWTIGEAHPSDEKFKLLDDKMHELMAKHNVKAASYNQAWNILTIDVLGVSLFSEKDTKDPDPWGDKEFGDDEEEDVWLDDDH